MPSKKIDPTILEELLNEFQDQDYGELIAGIEAEPEEKPLEELIRKAYKDHELAKDMLAALHEQESCKACCWPKQIRKILHCNKSECSIVNGLIYYRNRLFVPDSPNLCLEVVHHRPPRLYQDPGPPQPDLLVAWHLTIHSHLCQGLCPLFPHKDPTLCTTWFPETPRITSLPMD